MAEHILKSIERSHGWRELSLSAEALLAIKQRHWPGYIRQLENTLARAVIAARGRTILPEQIPPNVPQRMGTNTRLSADVSIGKPR
jgi:two-component system, NtrC family, response regulator AtoC